MADNRPPRPFSKRRYGWFRQYNDFPFHAKWSVVADRTGVDLCRVLGVVTCLEVAANKGKPRGSIADFSVLECAAALRMPASEVRKAYRCLEKLGWIDREYLTTWDERQPDKEDPTNADRQQRHRQKKRAERTASGERNAVTRVMSTTRPDQIENLDATATVDIQKLGKTAGERLTWGEAQELAKQQRSSQQLHLRLPVVVKRRGHR